MTVPSERRAVGLARGIGLFCGVLVIASLVLLLLDWRAIDSPDTALLPVFLASIVSGALGVLIVSRQPRHRIGWLLLAVAACAAINLVLTFVTMRALLSGVAPDSWVEWTAWPIGDSLLLTYVLLIFMALLFPDGKLPSHQWRGVAWYVFATIAALAVAGMFIPGSNHVSPRLASIPTPISVQAFSGLAPGGNGPIGLLWLAGFVAIMFVVAAVGVRMRDAGAVERTQLRWFAYVAGTAGAAIILSNLIGSTSQTSNVLSEVGRYGWFVAVPATIGLAIIKYGLYDIDVFISRTLVYGSLAVVITAVYVGIAVGIGTLVGSGGKPNLGLSILATAIVAVGFQPLRERLQRFANRLVYGKRATPYEVLSQFSGRVAESYASDEVLPRMARVLGEGTGAELAEVWLRSGDELRCAASYPAAQSIPEPVQLETDVDPTIPKADRTAMVRHQGELLGGLTVTKRRGESVTPIEIKLMDDLAHQAGLVLKNVGLTADLQARLEDLRASRQRLVAAQDDERRRLERNLHDGAQQHLVAIKVKLGLVEMLAMRDPEKAKLTVVELKQDADEALETLRDLARGIYPPLLADKGLAAALQAHARKATLAVRVDADNIGRYAPETEAAVYFCTLEALQNVQKYADASIATVRLHEDGEQLLIEVADDGRGFDTSAAKRGAGLTNMEDRLDALGGTLQIQSKPGAGTTLRAAVPALRLVTVAS